MDYSKDYFGRIYYDLKFNQFLNNIINFIRLI